MRASIEEYRAVEKAAMKFVKSVAEGNSRYAKELFIDEAVLFGYLDGKLEHGNIEQFYRNVDTVGAGDDFKAHIDVVDIEETLAVVRILEEKWSGRIDFTDYLLLMKMDGEWKCVAKAYNQNSNTIKGRKSMKIVVVTGSPRKFGNSFSMTEAFIKEAEQCGHSVKRFDAAFMKIGGCHA